MVENPDDDQRWVPPTTENLPGAGTPAYSGGQQHSSGKATAALVLGILGFVLCPLTSILALVFGYSARKEIDRSNGTIGNRGLATAGIVLGWVMVGLFVLIVVLVVVLAIASPGSFDDSSSSAVVPVLV